MPRPMPRRRLATTSANGVAARASRGLKGRGEGQQNEQDIDSGGWSKTVYMTAAAAAIEALKWKADVAGVSMDALVGALKDRAPNYKTVFVLGVGLKKNISQTISMLMR